jgi:stage V sporulation protein G
MEITEVRVRLVRNRHDRLKAFCSITLDNEFVVRDIRIIEGPEGYFLAMPSRKVRNSCGRCGEKNCLSAKFCNGCGAPLPDSRTRKDLQSKKRLYADIAHPINPECRKRIQERLVLAYQMEMEKSKQPGYKPVELDDLDGEMRDRTQ